MRPKQQVTTPAVGRFFSRTYSVLALKNWGVEKSYEQAAANNIIADADVCPAHAIKS
jgi:hypothetical protein